jgi:hypothetical protein
MDAFVGRKNSRQIALKCGGDSMPLLEPPLPLFEMRTASAGSAAASPAPVSLKAPLSQLACSLAFASGMSDCAHASGRRNPSMKTPCRSPLATVAATSATHASTASCFPKPQMCHVLFSSVVVAREPLALCTSR